MTTTNTNTITRTRNFATLAEFVASKIEVADTGAHLGFDSGDGVARRGFVYADCCYIDYEKDIATGAETGEFFLCIERSTWLDRDLAKLESILWAEHYLFDTADVVLSVDDGTLDDFVRAICAAYSKPVDGDLFGVLFSGKSEWTPGEAREVVVNAITYRSADDVALPMADRLQMMADRKTDDVPNGDGRAPIPLRSVALTEAELSNLITACKTSSMRTGSTDWQTGLDAIAAKLYAARGF